MSSTNHAMRWRKAIDRGLQRPMAMLALFFLVLLAIWIPHLENGHSPAFYAFGLIGIAEILLVWLYPIFWVELAVRLAWLERGTVSRKRLTYFLSIALVPPLRVGLRPATAPHMLWVPVMGWLTANRGVRKRLERDFSIPMMLIALMILPVLAVELLWSEVIHHHPMLLSMLDVSTRVIWLAFAVEFTVIMAAARRKWRYATTHWVDLAIILFPLISFLRVFRVLRLTRLLRAARVTQLARTYRLRGLAFRGFRALMLLRVLDRVSTRFTERRIAACHRRIRKHHEEITELEEELKELESDLAARRHRESGPPPEPEIAMTAPVEATTPIPEPIDSGIVSTR